MTRIIQAFLLAFATAAQAQEGLVETTTLVPLGVNPSIAIQQRILAAPPCANKEQQGCRENVTLAAFRVDVWFPYGLKDLFPGGEVRIAIESELAPGVPAPQTPVPLPPAHLRQFDPQGNQDPRATSIPLRPDFPPEIVDELRHQTGINHHYSPWIVVIADPRASGTYEWPADVAKKDRGCPNCDRPLHLEGKSGVHEIAPAGPYLRIRLDVAPGVLETLPDYAKHLAQRLESRVRVVPADLTRPSPDAYAAFNPPTDGFRMAQMAMLHTREIAFSATDLGVRARNTGVALTRVYSSAIAHFGPFGRNFDSPWFARIRELPDGSAELYDGTGRRDTFVRVQGTNDYHAPPGVFLDLRRSADGFVLIGRGESRMLFDSNGRLVRMSDGNTTTPDASDGNSVRFLYEAGGRLTSVVDPVGRAFAIDYWESSGDGGYPGLVASVTDFSGRRVDYRYDASGRLVEVSGPDAESAASETPRTRYAWNEGSGSYQQRLYRSGQIKLERDGEDRIAWEAVYDDAKPWAAAAILSGGGTWSLSASGALREVLDPLGIKTAYAHDAAGRAVAIADAQNATQTFAFDGEGRLLSSSEPLGEKTEYAYTSASGSRRHQANVASVVQHPRPGTPEAVAKLARKSEWKYDAMGRVAEVIAPDGSKQTIVRDARGNPAAVTDASGVTTINVFDARGLLITTSDPRSGTTSFTYEPGGFLKALTTAAGTTSLETDARGNVVKATDATGKSAAFTFNALDQLEVETRGTSESRLRYDATGAVIEKKTLVALDDDGQPVWQAGTSVIDELGRVRESAMDGVVTTWTYDAAGNTKSVVGPGAPPTVYGYDALGRIGSLEIGPRKTTYAYDLNGGSASVTDSLGRTTHFLSDGFGSSIGTLDPTGVKTVDRHDAAGRPVDSRVIKVNADGSELLLRWTVREFDDAGRLVKETRKLFTAPLPLPKDGSDPTGAKDVVLRTVYDDEARTVTQIDPLGRATRSEMDELGRLARVVDAAGNVLEIGYDAAGNRSSESFYALVAGPRGAAVPAAVAAASRRRADDSLALHSRILYLYDDQNRVAAVHDVSDPATSPLVTSYAYDRRGNVVTVTDPQRRETKFEYDIRNRRIRTIDAGGAVTKFEWDDADRLVAVVDANLNRTEWIWDASGRLAEEKRADGASWKYAYDAQGNRTTTTDPNGTVTTYQRDALDRLTGITIQKAQNVLGPASITYVLDDLGRVIATETSEGVRTATSFDSLDRALRDAVRIGEGSERALTRTFDDAGQPVGLAYPSGLAISRSFDALGRIEEIRDAGTALVARWRDEGMRQVEREGGNGVVDRWAWDARSRLTSIESGPPCGAAAGCDPLRRVEYARAPMGAKEEVLRPDLALRRTYRLDRLDRVVEESRVRWPDGHLASSMRFLLDGALNARAIERDAVQSVATIETTVNARNQITAAGAETLQWDASGNLVARQGVALGYDAAGRMARAALADGTTIEMLRDAYGRKVRETLSFAGSSRVTDSVHDGARVIEQWVGGSAVAGVPPPNPILHARYVHGRGIDEIVRAERDTNLDGTLDQTLWPLQDELGTVDALTDSGGAVIARFDYGPYGLPLTVQAETAASLADWPWLFQGREWNEHLRAYDFRARTLWPDLGRFGQEDPAGMSDSPNLYQALLGNWTGATDPSGEVVVLMHGIRDDGWNSDWANTVSYQLGRTWQAAGADPGQDVVNLLSRQGGGFKFFGLCNDDTFCLQNAHRAAGGNLDGATMRAGNDAANLFKILRAKLNESRTRKIEPIQVLAHSHGSAILAAAAMQNNNSFHLSRIVLVGSDLDRLSNLTSFVKSSWSIVNYYSYVDNAVHGWELAGGGEGFQEPVPYSSGYGLQKHPRLIQRREPGIEHSADPVEIATGVISWVSKEMAEYRYAEHFAIFDPRSAKEHPEWIAEYQKVRILFGQDRTIRLRNAFWNTYRPRHRHMPEYPYLPRSYSPR